MENSIDVPQKIKNRTTLQCSNSTFKNPKTTNMLILKDICTPIFVTAYLK